MAKLEQPISLNVFRYYLNKYALKKRTESAIDFFMGWESRWRALQVAAGELYTIFYVIG